MRALLLTLAILTACSSEPEIERSPVSVSSDTPDEGFPGCPTGGNKPSPLPAIRQAQEILVKLDEWEKYGASEDQAGKTCRVRFYKFWKEHRDAPPH